MVQDVGYGNIIVFTGCKSSNNDTDYLSNIISTYLEFLICNNMKEHRCIA